MAATTVSTVASLRRTKWLTKILGTMTSQFVLDKFADNEIMGRGEGGTLVMNRHLRPNKQTTAGTPGTMIAGGDSSAKAIYSNKVELTPQLYQDFFAFEDQVDFETFLSKESSRQLVADQMRRSMEYLTMKFLCQQGLRHRADGLVDTANQKSGVAVGSSTNVSLTLASGHGTGIVAGARLVVTTPNYANYDHPAFEVASVATDTVTFTAGTRPPQDFGGAGTGYRIVQNASLTSAAPDILGTAMIWDVVGAHLKLTTEKFDDGLYRMFVDAAQYRDLWTDSVFQDSAKYSERSQFKGFEVARWAGVEIIVGTEMYRENTSNAEVTDGTGTVYCSPVIGKHAFHLVPWGGGGSGKFNVKWMIVDQPDSYNVLNNKNFLGWKTYWAGKVTRSTSAIILLTGATSQALVV